ncbi:MAG: SIP domain-containing protein [Leucobacter sp.]
MARSLRPLDVFPITTRTLEVLRVTDVTPGMRRVTLGGAELSAHIAANGYPVAAFRSDGFDDEFKILLKHPDAEVAVGPTQADGILNWPRGDEHLLLRTYTVRHWNPAAREIDVDFVIHGLGPATTWATTVTPGECVQIAGPKMSAGHPEGADWTLIAGDETALPAIGRWLEQWPEGAKAQVFIEVAEAQHRQELPEPPGVEITWLTRDGAEAGTTTLLFDAIRAAQWWEGTTFAWLAGEALTLTPIRRWLRNERGLDKQQLDVTGYWRRQNVVVSAEDATQVDLAATGDDEETLHTLGEIVPGFALRVAATIGLAEAFGVRERSLDELAAHTGVPTAGLKRLLRYLESIGVVEFAEGGAFQLSEVGRGLENEHLSEHLNLDGSIAHREVTAMLGLLEAIRNPEAEPAGPSYAESERDDPRRLAKRLEHDAEDGVYVVGALAETITLPEHGRIAILGTDGVGFAQSIVRKYPGVAATVVAAPSEIEVLSTLHRPHKRIRYEAGSLLQARSEQYDAVLLVDAFRELPEADAVHALREAAASVGSSGQVWLFSEPLDIDLAFDHDYEEDLIVFVLHRGALRTSEEHLALFEAAGLPVPAQHTVGWGYSLYSVSPGDRS